LAKCLLLTLGVKLMTLAISVFLSRSGVRVSSTPFPRGRVGVILLLARRTSDLDVRLGIEDVDVETLRSCDNIGVDV
jgi:hypothetical protein